MTWYDWKYVKHAERVAYEKHYSEAGLSRGECERLREICTTVSVLKRTYLYRKMQQYLPPSKLAYMFDGWYPYEPHQRQYISYPPSYQPGTVGQ